MGSKSSGVRYVTDFGSRVIVHSPFNRSNHAVPSEVCGVEGARVCRDRARIAGRENQRRRPDQRVVVGAGPTGAALSVPMRAPVVHRRGITRGINHRSARADANRSTIARVRAAIRAASCSVVGYRNRAGRSASGSGPVWPVRPFRSDPFNASGPGRVRSDSQRGESPSVTPGELGAASLAGPATVVSE